MRYPNITFPTPTRLQEGQVARTIRHRASVSGIALPTPPKSSDATLGPVKISSSPAAIPAADPNIISNAVLAKYVTLADSVVSASDV